MPNLRRFLMGLPVAERRQALAKQAEEMKLHYRETREERISRQGGRVFDYSDSELDPSSADSAKQDAEEGGS